MHIFRDTGITSPHNGQLIVNNEVVSKHTLEKYMKLKGELDKSRSNNYFNIDYPPLPLIEGF